jgi:hypothetical protein
MSGLGAAFSVLMIGHSLFAFDGPSMLQSALRAGTGQGTVEAQIINGAPLKYNWEKSESAEGVDARAELPRGEVTHLILTEAVPLANHLKWSETGLYAEAFASLALNAVPKAKVYVQETWHDLRSGSGVDVEYDDNDHIPWRDRLRDDLPAWENVVAELASGHPAQRRQFQLIPAGQALGLLHDRIAEGGIDGLDEIADVFGDNIHLNHTGHYFVAMVQYATLTGESPLGLPVDFSNRFGEAFDTPGPDLARQLQEVAWEAVETYRNTGAIPVAAAPPAPPRDVATPAAPRAPPAIRVEDLPDKSASATGEIGLSLAELKDWSTQQPFLDLMKTARPWIGHEPGRFGGMDYATLRNEGYLDADGWPLRMPRTLSSIGTLILTDMPEEAQSLAGRYRLSYSGKGVIEVTGRATGVRYGPGEVTFDYEPGPGPVDIRIQRINTSDPPRITSIVKLDQEAAFRRGEIFNPLWLDRIRGVDGLRFMDWTQVNDSTLSNWSDRPKVTDATWFDGVPFEIMIALANEIDANPWFNVPHLADDDFVRSLAELVEAGVEDELTVYVEFSNEVWNWQFAQARWAEDRAKERWGVENGWVQYYALRASEVARLFSEVFAQAEGPTLVNVISSQTGWIGLEKDVLEAPLVMDEGLPAPAEAFDAYAVSGYFGGNLGTTDAVPMVEGWLQESAAEAERKAAEQGLSGQAAEDYILAHRFDLATERAAEALAGSPEGLPDLLTRLWPYHAEIAARYGLDLLIYEGGSHIVGVGPVVNNTAVSEFMQHLNYAPEMTGLYDTLLAAWRRMGAGMFVHYADVQKPTKWGSWGALRHLDDQNPRWDALVRAR